MASSESRWWLAAKKHRETMLRAALEQVYMDANDRLRRYADAVQFYADSCEVSIGGTPYGPATIDLNLIRTLVQTARSMLVQFPAPRPQAQTSGARAGQQKKAQGLTRWCDGQIRAAQIDKKLRGRTALRSACCGTGVLWYRSRFGRIEVEELPPWQVLAHRDDEQQGQLRTIYVGVREDRGQLQHEYPALADDIEDCTGDILPWSMDNVDQDDGHKVSVVHAWHLPSAPGAKDGRYTVAMADKLLRDERCDDADFPLTFYHWSEPLSGFWPGGIADDIGGIQYQITRLVNRLQDMIDLVCSPRVWIPKMANPTPWPPTNDPGAPGIFFSGPTVPQWDIARKVDPEITGQIERLWGKGFQIEGLSEMAAMAMKPGGLDSGAAIRAWAEKSSGRTANWSLNQQDVMTDAGPQLARQGRRIAKQVPDFAVQVPNRKRNEFDTVVFRDVDLPDDETLWSWYVTSSLPEDPAGRQAKLQEQLGTGAITQAQYWRQMRNPDLEAEAALAEAPHAVLVEQLEEILYGDGVYQQPEPDDDLQDALQTGLRYYAKARLDQTVGEDRLKLVRQWLAAVKATIKKGAQAQQGPAAGPPALPPGGAPPMPVVGPMPAGV